MARRSQSRRATVGTLLILAVAGGGIAAASTGSSSAATPGTGNWALTQMRATQAWRASTGEGVIIGVVDSGVDPRAPGLSGKILDTADCVGSGGAFSDCRPGAAPDLMGHGTIVTQVAAAMAPGARFVEARGVGDSPAGWSDDIAAGVDWVVDHGAQIVNLSVAEETAGQVVLSPDLADAVERAWARGAIPVVAAGNAGGFSPYGSLDALVVGATTPEGNLATYSDRPATAKWGIAAPGGAVSDLPSGATVQHLGTSIAAPNVSATLALLLAVSADPSAAVRRLIATAVPCPGCGAGRVNAAAALGVPTVNLEPQAPSTVAPTTTTTVPAPPLSVPDAAVLDQAPSLSSLSPKG